MIRGKILLWVLLVMAVAAAGLGLAQLWLALLPETYFMKSMATLLVLGTLVSLFIAVDYDLPGSRRKIMLLLIAGLIALGGLIITGHIWLALLSVGIFVKTLISLGVVIGLLSFAMASIEDLGSNKKLRDGNYID